MCVLYLWGKTKTIVRGGEQLPWFYFLLHCPQCTFYQISSNTSSFFKNREICLAAQSSVELLQQKNQLVQEGEPSTSLAQVLGSLLLPSPGQNKSEPDLAKPRHPVHPDGQCHPRGITSGSPCTHHCAADQHQ